LRIFLSRPGLELIEQGFGSWLIDFSLILKGRFESCACRKLNPAILVMQSAQDWATENVPGAIDGARDRCIFLQG